MQRNCILQNEELSDLHSSLNTVRVIKFTIIRWEENVAFMVGGEAYAGFWLGNLRKKNHLGDPGVDGKIILRWIFRKWNVGIRTG